MLKLHGYYRSSAAFRVRIALEIKNIEWESVPVNLGSSEQSLENFLIQSGFRLKIQDNEWNLITKG